MCHVSRVTCHVSQSGEAYWWRVCYQRGLPHLVYKSKDIKIASLVKKLLKICWICGFLLVVDLHWEGSAITRLPSSFFLACSPKELHGSQCEFVRQCRALQCTDLWSKHHYHSAGLPALLPWCKTKLYTVDYSRLQTTFAVNSWLMETLMEGWHPGLQPRYTESLNHLFIYPMIPSMNSLIVNNICTAWH